MRLKQINWRDLIERAAWTFVQGAVAVWVISDEPFTTQALVGAIGAGLSALKTFVITWLEVRKR